jgi:DNA N-6-adenine-methyltransferase (Dam)
VGHLVDAIAVAPDATNGWMTPPGLLAALGPFDLDPCANTPDQWDPGRVRRCIARPDDGLTAPWAGMVWVNPPYTDTARWMARLAGHGNGIALIFARTETGWFAEHVWGKASGLLFVKGRIRFIRVSNGSVAGHNAPAPSVLVAYGTEAAARLAACGIEGARVYGWERPYQPPAQEGLFA